MKVIVQVKLLEQLLNKYRVRTGAVLPLGQLGSLLGRKPERGAVLNLKERRLYTKYCFKLALAIA